jgi:cytochrome c-type biogenesis protein CcmE
MTNKQRLRLWNIILLLVGAGAVLTFVLVSLNQQMLFFLTPSQLHDHPSRYKAVRLGGVVKEGSIQRLEKGIAVRFVVTDFNQEQDVYFRGLPPDLFREGQGVIAEGKIERDGIFIASQLLAKHDENYMPKGVYEQLRQSQNK